MCIRHNLSISTIDEILYKIDCLMSNNNISTSIKKQIEIFFEELTYTLLLREDNISLEICFLKEKSLLLIKFYKDEQLILFEDKIIFGIEKNHILENIDIKKFDTMYNLYIRK